MRGDPFASGREGFALMTVMLVVIVVAILVTSAVVVGSTHLLSNRYYDRQSELDAVAMSGLELARAALNGDRSLYPDSGYVVLENGVAIEDAAGNPIPGVQRWLYAGPTGVTSGQYGVFGSIVSVVRDAGGGVAIRRSQVYQESFAKYAYFTDFEPTTISFGGGDQIYGPVHTNSDLKIYASGATFHDEARTVGEVVGGGYGDFRRGFRENVPRIDMPETAELTALQARATAGGTAFTTSSPSASGSARLRIHFVAVDLPTGETEGFFRVYRSNDWRWLSGDVPSGGMSSAENCGDYHGSTFISALDHPAGGHNWLTALQSSTRHCYLGGSDEIFGGFVPDDGKGQWDMFTTTPSPLLSGRPDAQYLFPLSRALNPSFQGVIHVDGKVLISGKVRGRVTLASTNEIIIGDDVTYVTDPGVGTCEDILGLFSGNDVVIADNMLNTPQRPTGSGSTYYTYTEDRGGSEYIHAIILALNEFRTENFNTGPTSAERCEGVWHGRGCLYLTGGVIQNRRGPVGTLLAAGVNGHGYIKRYAYDRCGATSPPPYFPTTGHFARGQTYWVDPAGFDIDDHFDLLTAGP